MGDSTRSAAQELACFNGIGGFSQRGEYEIHIENGVLPPAPWINVIANPAGGFIISEAGSGPTWAVNSSFFRITPWENDPVSDPPGDCIYIRDEQSGEAWTPTPAPILEHTRYVVRHGAGYTIFEHTHDEIVTSLRAGVPESDAVKIQVLSISNTSDRARKLVVTTFAELLLGTDRERTAGHVRTEFDRDSEVILAANTFEPDYAGQVVFATVSDRVASFTTNRSGFLGRNGFAGAPAALSETCLDGMAGAPDPCAALQAAFTLEPGDSRDIVVLLGSGAGREEALALASRYREPEKALAALDRAAAAWRRRLDAISVKTPEPTFDLIVNGWALYQALSCRMWGRIALYQSSGAHGFRDQLQDVMAFVYAEPGIAREHIIAAASRQFEEGDVQHWWHPDSGRGIRTRFADDLIWLVYVVDHYVRVTGDASILDERAGYVKSRQLMTGEDELYDVPEISDRSDSVYDHCVLALRRACTAGAHGLPLIGGGDWNDGMNRVGIGERGESVWLAWFLAATLRRFIEHSKARGDESTAIELAEIADAYCEAVEATSWDGAWYRRAYYDDGTPLGARGNSECAIDSIAQSWSVISGAGDRDRSRIAMKSLEERLVLEDARMVLLLTPPFDEGTHDPGYIRGYLPGVRENGGQYTHAALWAVLATAMMGKGGRALELYQMINPITHGDSPAQVEKYKVEPYVVAADVYTAEGHVGRGGWTWYTGSASWLYRVGLEAILGFVKRGENLHIEPCIPSGWREFTIDYRYGETPYSIVVRNPGGLETGAATVTVDGETGEMPIVLVDDGRKRSVVVTLSPTGNA